MFPGHVRHTRNGNGSSCRDLVLSDGLISAHRFALHIAQEVSVIEGARCGYHLAFLGLKKGGGEGADEVDGGERVRAAKWGCGR